MKKVLKILLIVLLVILANIGILVNTVQAVENGEKITIYSKGYFNRVIRNNGIVIKTAHAVYQENGKEYPVYCLNRELHGVGEYIATYDVKDQGKIEDLGLWRVVINGYPYKSIEQLGVTNEEEAYIATKQSIYCYIYNTGTELYSAINEQGERVINAMNNILENAKNSNESFDNPNIEIEQSEKWNVDEIENKYVSKEYKIKSNKNISKITLNLESQPKGTKIINLDEDGKFKILIPIENLKDLIIYQSQNNDNVSVEVLYDNEDFWLTQKSMSKLFEVEVNTINYHLKEIFKSGELTEESVIRKIRITANDGKNYNTNFYSLDAIIAVGYRVNSKQATD